MNESVKIKWFYIISITFLIINAFCTAFEFYWFNLLPVVLTIAGMFFLSLDKVFLLIVFCTPLSVNLENKDVRLGLSLPTEPLMILLMLMFFVRLILEGKYDKKISQHPVTIAIICQLTWTLVTAVTSTLPVISFKFLLAKMWFLTTGYFFAITVFKDFKNIYRFLWLFIIPMAGVSIYTIIQHSQFAFDEETSHWVMSPFFNDHTSYGAILAMFYPIILGFLTSRLSSGSTKMFAGIMLFIYTVAIILSYTRAAWVSLIAAFALYMIMFFRVKLNYLFTLLGIVVLGLILNQDKLLMKLEKNRQDSSNNLQEHVQSISNISSDASNLERLNRWSCAMRMFNEKPVFGWGPGTYSFQYAPFQRANEKTIISTNNGDGGNAHSEYLGPLCEQGVLGTITFLAVVFSVVIMAFRLFYTSKSREVKFITLVCFLGLMTYVVHGFLNNFLDTDKAAVPFWGFVAIMVAMDLYHDKKDNLYL